MTLVTAIIIGAGSRGEIYAGYSDKNPDFKVLGVADPSKIRRERLAKRHNIPDKSTFSNWEEILAQEKFADACIIATPDNMHYEPAIAAMKLGYEILLEKPMSPSEQECIDLVEISKKTSTLLQICHVLRHTSFYSRIHEVIQSGDIGDIVNISMRENVAYYHYAHSYIRGNWNNREESAPMILAKCSHDLDLIQWFLGDSRPRYISSFGSLSHFDLEKKKFAVDRDNIPDRCTDGCPVAEDCVYYAPRIYRDITPLLHIARKSSPLGEKLVAKSVLKFPGLKSIPPFSLVNNYYGWPVDVICDDGSLESKQKALEKGPYGLCVYRVAEHNTVDHQMVNIELSGVAH